MDSDTKLWNKTARTIVRAGNVPFPITSTLINLLKVLITEDQAKFILNFMKPSLNMNQLKKKTGLGEVALTKILNELMDNGIIVGSKSRKMGIEVYRLMGPFPGIFEYSLMKGETNERDKKIANLFDKLFSEMSEGVQLNYENIASQYKNFPIIGRVIPVEKEIDIGQEEILTTEMVSKIIENNDDIARAYCYCRHEKDLINEPCKLDAPRDNCILLGKSAQFAIKHNFAKPISKEEVIQIFKEAEEYGLVHKVFHVHMDTKREVESICSCCRCCCGIFQLYYLGIMPFNTVSSYLAEISKEDCIGCATCVEKCPIEAISLEGSIAFVNNDKCIGCGVCSYHCPEEAIKLKRTGYRNVLIPPIKLK